MASKKICVHCWAKEELFSVAVCCAFFHSPTVRASIALCCIGNCPSMSFGGCGRLAGECLQIDVRLTRLSAYSIGGSILRYLWSAGLEFAIGFEKGIVKIN